MFTEYLYTDASTIKNGQPGQNTTILVCDEFLSIRFEKNIGDYSTNEGELLAIIACFKNVAPGQRIKIYSDSMIAVNWINHGIGKKSKATERTKKWIPIAHQFVISTKSTVQWVSRNVNLAGHIFEERQNEKIDQRLSPQIASIGL